MSGPEERPSNPVPDRPAPTTGDVLRGDHVQLFEDKAGEWRWRAVSGNGETVAGGEGHRDPTDALRAAHDAATILATALNQGAVLTLKRLP